MQKSSTQPIGKLGEDIACRYLRERGFSVLERNYRKKWGEIDVIARFGRVLHFVEVKAVTQKEEKATSDTSKPFPWNTYEPEENIHYKKIKRLERAIGSYLLERKIPQETSWQIDALAIFLDLEGKQARCRLTEQIVL